MNIKKMMQQAQKMQEQMLAAQEELAEKTVTATGRRRQGDRSWPMARAK
jgi:DNA-binding protein YbaB